MFKRKSKKQFEWKDYTGFDTTAFKVMIVLSAIIIILLIATICINVINNLPTPRYSVYITSYKVPYYCYVFVMPYSNQKIDTYFISNPNYVLYLPQGNYNLQFQVKDDIENFKTEVIPYKDIYLKIFQQ